jgi:hypothetical protein
MIVNNMLTGADTSRHKPLYAFTCAVCGRQSQSLSPRTVCSVCYLASRRGTAMRVPSAHRCIVCGAVLPATASAGRMYCDECVIVRRKSRPTRD